MSIIIENAKQHTLEWINAIRTEHGRKPLAELPKGSLRDPHGCVIHNALKDVFPNQLAVNGSRLIYNSPDGHLQRVKLPPAGESFVEYFDSERIPELVG